MVKEFIEFIQEYKVLSLAVAFVMGTASTALVNSLVKDIIMPLLSPLLRGGAWKEAMFSVGPVQIAYGSFLAELINFIILALVIFVVAKKILKIEPKK